MLPPAPQRWTKVNTYNKNYIAGCIVAHGCEIWSLTSKWEQRLSVFHNKVLRKIFGAKRDKITAELRKLHNSQLHALYSLLNIITNLKSIRLRRTENVARMKQSRDACRDLVGTPEGNIPLREAETQVGG